MEDLKAVWEAELQNTEMAMEQNRHIKRDRDELKQAYLELKQASEANTAGAAEPHEAALREAQRKTQKLERVATQLHTLGALRQILYLVLHPRSMAGSMLCFCFQKWKDEATSHSELLAGDQEATRRAMCHVKALMQLSECARSRRVMACSRCFHAMSRNHAEWRGGRAVMNSPGTRRHRGSKRVKELCDENAGVGSMSPIVGGKAVSPSSPSLTLSLSPSRQQNATDSPSSHGQPLVFDTSRGVL